MCVWGRGDRGEWVFKADHYDRQGSMEDVPSAPSTQGMIAGHTADIQWTLGPRADPNNQSGN